MNLLEILRSPSQTPTPSWRGTWARIWLQPSIFSAQKYLVGAAAMDSQGLCDFRLISGTAKFECIYGDQGALLVDQLLTDARAALGLARQTHAPVGTGMLPPGIELEPVGYAADLTAEMAVENMLDEAEIPMEPMPEQSKAARFKSRAADDVMRDLFNAIRQKMGTGAEQVLRVDHFGDEKHTGTVNLVLPKAAGILANGWFASSERVQLELLKSANMVESYMKLHGKHGQPGVFLLRPTVADGLNPKQSEAIEQALDQLDWHLEKKGMRVTTRNSEAEIAADVAEWIAS